MSELQTAGKVQASSNLYTALLALACGIVLATAGFVSYKCWFDYGTLFKITEYIR
jgi:hypothetical protein